MSILNLESSVAKINVRKRRKDIKDSTIEELNLEEIEISDASMLTFYADPFLIPSEKSLTKDEIYKYLSDQIFVRIGFTVSESYWKSATVKVFVGSKIDEMYDPMVYWIEYSLGIQSGESISGASWFRVENVKLEDHHTRIQLHSKEFGLSEETVAMLKQAEKDLGAEG